ncbi:WD40-repeat-containing domain protein [Scheffersomyces xylosifermentans]|uniref:WD40-repeat-containing domain protein n=1 Tax=Scheffersomyces xylosifermentans TaxID=1304137 RepID=UPI00315C7D18
MAPISEFERQRQENIQRNKDLLKQLNLDSISQSISKEISKPNQAAKRRKTATRSAPVKKEVVEPSRRSRRIAGIKTELENPEEYNRLREEEEEKERKKKELERLKRTRLFGDFNLIDLVTDRKSGNLKFEGKVIKAENGISTSNGRSKRVKKEEPEEASLDDNNAEVDVEEENRVLERLKVLGDKFSAGDFYDVIRQAPIEYDDKILERTRKSFDKLKIYEKFDPLDIKISHNRITSINFHPSTTDRVVVAGDTTGNVGIWAVDSAEESGDPTISILRPHGKAISRILTPTKSPTKIYTASYDGSVRELDLNKLASSELIYINDPYDKDALGVSDINLTGEDQNLLYATTLSGVFFKHDLRTKFKAPKEGDLWRLHDKKIGSFSINPNNSYQIATASLDRTLRIWDLRNVSKDNAEWSEFEQQISPHLYGSYSSRLSVSSVDWNSENRLVCNGYDDTINIFDLSGTDGELPPVTEWNETFQPNVSKKSRRKKTEDDEESLVPDNIKPFNKIRHNCQTGRWVSILKSKWQVTPNDGVQKFVIANMNRGLDVYDQKGSIIAHLTESVGAVPAVCQLHPTQNWVVGGSASGKVYLFN